MSYYERPLEPDEAAIMEEMLLDRDVEAVEANAQADLARGVDQEVAAEIGTVQRDDYPDAHSQMALARIEEAKRLQDERSQKVARDHIALARSALQKSTVEAPNVGPYRPTSQDRLTRTFTIRQRGSGRK